MKRRVPDRNNGFSLKLFTFVPFVSLVFRPFPAKNGGAEIIYMPSILFVCTGNLYRSPLAAARFRQKLREGRRSHSWIVESAGTWTEPGLPIPPEVLLVPEVRRMDLERHITRQVNSDLLAGYDLILVMEKGHKEALRIEFPQVAGRLHLLSELVDGLAYDIQDPLRSGQALCEVAAEMFRLIDRGYQKICESASTLHKDQP